MSKTMWLILGGLALWWYKSQTPAVASTATIPYGGNALVDYGCEIYPGSLAPQATVKSPGVLAPNNSLVSALEVEGYSGSLACQIVQAPQTVPLPVYRAVRQAGGSGLRPRAATHFCAPWAAAWDERECPMVE